MEEAKPRRRSPIEAAWFRFGSEEGTYVAVLILFGSIGATYYLASRYFQTLIPYWFGYWGILIVARFSWFNAVYPDPFGKCSCPHGFWCRLSRYNPFSKADMEEDDGTAPRRRRRKHGRILTLNAQRDAVIACRTRCKHHEQCYLVQRMSNIEEPEYIRGRGYIRKGDVWISPDYTEVVFGGQVQPGNFTIENDTIVNHPTRRRTKQAK